MSHQPCKKGETSSQSAASPLFLNMLREPYVGKTRNRVPVLEKGRGSDSWQRKWKYQPDNRSERLDWILEGRWKIGRSPREVSR